MSTSLVVHYSNCEHVCGDCTKPKSGKRRRYKLDEKLQMVREASRSSVSATARRYGIATRLLFAWKKQLASTTLVS